MREYLESDIGKREEECSGCPARRTGDLDEEGYCPVCPMRRLDALYPAEFRAWAGDLVRLHNWRKAGYAITEELSAAQWDALALITRWFEVRDAEAQMAQSPAPSTRRR